MNKLQEFVTGIAPLLATDLPPVYPVYSRREGKHKRRSYRTRRRRGYEKDDYDELYLLLAAARRRRREIRNLVNVSRMANAKSFGVR